MAGTGVRCVRWGAAGAALLGSILGAAAAARATTIVPIEDGRLVDASPVIVVGKVEGKLPPTGLEFTTRWLVTVERVLKGQVTAGSIVVEVPGGENAAGDRLVLFGAPDLHRHGRVLLMLRPGTDGAWRIHQFTLGVFHRLDGDGRAVAVQDLSEVRVVGRRARARERARPRDFELFTDWIEDRVAGDARPADYRVRMRRSGLRALRQAFTLFTDDGIYYRWFDFDGGGGVPFARNGVQNGTLSGGVLELERARAAWNNEPTTPVNLTDGGVTDADGGLRHSDGTNTVLFDDPFDEVDDLDYEGGGALAIGGIYTRGIRRDFGGRDFYDIAEGDVVMNNGLEYYLQRATSRTRYIERLLGHELGHTLGIRHSSESQYERKAALRNALMYFQLSHHDDRGARLEADDIAALQTLYRVGGAIGGGGGGGGGSGGGGGGGGGFGNCPDGMLCLLDGRFQVTATYENQFNGRSGSAHPVQSSDSSGYFYFDDGRNYELIFKMLDFGDVVKVFYGQLTNLHFTISVRDTRGGGAVKTYTNTTGDCGGLDAQGFPSAAVVGRFRSRRANAGQGTCHEDADTICLLDGRYAVEATWRNQYNNASGAGIPTRLTDLTGAFGFTSSSNLELLVKTVQFPDRVVVLYGALSDLEYRLRVTDTVLNRTKEYFNPAGRYCGGLDNAF